MAPQLLFPNAMMMPRIPRLPQRLLSAVVAGLSVYVLAACAPKGASAPVTGLRVPGAPYQDEVTTPGLELGNDPGRLNLPRVPGPEQLAQNNNTPLGTGDLGGGDGLDGKLFEAYVVDIQKDADFIKYLQPIDQRLLKLYQSGAGTETEDTSKTGVKTEMGEGLAPIAFGTWMKQWYIAPVNLHRIDKKHLGVDFVMDPVQQMALQNRREVWIDKNLLPKDPVERARLYLHEAMMSFYMLQFEDLETICKDMKPGAKCSEDDAPEKKVDDPPLIDASGLLDFFRLIIAPKPRRALNANDYANVRAVTDFLFTRSNELQTYQDLKALFVNKGFDGRMFGEYNTPEFENNEDFREIKRNKMDKEQVEQGQRIAQALRQSSISGHGPRFCRFNDIGDATSRCDVQFGKLLPLKNGQTVLPIHFKVTDLQGKVLQEASTRIIVEKELKLWETSISSGFKNANVYFYDLGASMIEDAEGKIVDEVREGDRAWSLRAYLVGSDLNTDILGFEIRPYLVTEIMAGSIISAKTPTFEKIYTEMVLKQEKISGTPGINRQYPNGHQTTIHKLAEQKQLLCEAEKTCPPKP